jgi:2-polyprenyl-3-methyl-5-hydroxy-6-metoxy-1,4-benzoquinol methylase
VRVDDPRWNLNTHCHRVVVDAVPTGAATALDIGTGDGLLAFDLADRGLAVSSIDPDALSVRRAAEDARCAGSSNRNFQALDSSHFSPAATQ